MFRVVGVRSRYLPASRCRAQGYASGAAGQPELRRPPPDPPARPSSRLDDFIVRTARSLRSGSIAQAGPSLYTQSQRHAGVPLEDSVPYEAYPSHERRADAIPTSSAANGVMGDGLVLVVHAVMTNGSPDFTVCSGFAVKGDDPAQSGRQLVVTCAHTLLEIEQRHPGKPTVSFIVASGSTGEDGNDPLVLPIVNVLASIPRSDLLALSVPVSPTLRTLPLSPYPMYRGQPLLMHFFGSPDPPEPAISPLVAARNGTAKSEGDPLPALHWPGQLGWRRWVQGEHLGYRNSQWQEVEPGTSSALRFIMASPLPTPGSSGGPILDAKSGSVVGMISGRRMDNRVEGERGWGASAERIFDMFAIPGFVPASKKRR